MSGLTWPGAQDDTGSGNIQHAQKSVDTPRKYAQNCTASNGKALQTEADSDADYASVEIAATNDDVGWDPFQRNPASLDETPQHDPAGDYRASILQSPSSSEFLWCSKGVDDPESPDFRRAFSSASDIAFPDAHHGLDFEPFEQNSFEVRRK